MILKLLFAENNLEIHQLNERVEASGGNEECVCVCVCVCECLCVCVCLCVCEHSSISSTIKCQLTRCSVMQNVFFVPSNAYCQYFNIKKKIELLTKCQTAHNQQFTAETPAVYLIFLLHFHSSQPRFVMFCELTFESRAEFCPQNRVLYITLWCIILRQAVKMIVVLLTRVSLTQAQLTRSLAIFSKN